ncbi:MAG: hypothetical protein ACJ76A_03850 [Actinomycetota bacterium]
MRKALHALFGGLTRAVLIVIALMALIAAAPFLATWFDDRGIPGALIVGIVLLVAACSSGYAFFFTTSPNRKRSRALRQLGDEFGLPYSRRIQVPRRLRLLPSFAQLFGAYTIHDGIGGHRDDGPLLVFARSWSTDLYEPTHWALCAATTTMLAAPALLIGPRHLSVDELPIFDEMLFESDAFDHVWEVRTDDRLLASTIVDQRLMAWLLAREPDTSFELGGPWAMAVSHGMDPTAGRALVDALNGFLQHLPRVAISELGRGY